ncbi:amidohydrolase family protein, partial [bacterium AH-315-P15]|nr:amidohydrolase family protein [bacterium AH-315-P15]
MNDLVIRGGRIADGGGADTFTGDVAIKGGIITEIANRDQGENVGAGAREIDADGLLVTPGWVDIHTHYDAQATWDPYFTPSSWHGVTTTVMGNCGVGFAPAAPDQHDMLIDLMEGVEDIPGAALTEGMEWSWESFPEFLSAIEAKPHVIDFGTQVPHGPLRAYVMGDRGVANEDATAEDIARMARIVREGINAGALGFSTSRTSIHKAKSGGHVPGTYAAMDEVFGLGMALKDAGAGVFQMAIEHHLADENFVWMKRLAQETGRPVLFNLVQADKAPDKWKTMLKLLEEAARENIPIYGQTAGRPVGLLYNWRASVHPFVLCPTWQEIRDLPWP